MSASTSTFFGASLSAGAVPNRAFSTVIKRSSKANLLAAEDIGDGKLGDDRAAAPAAVSTPAGDAVGDRVDEARRILGGPARHVERGRGDRTARRRRDVGAGRIFGDHEVDGRVGGRGREVGAGRDIRG